MQDSRINYVVVGGFVTVMAAVFVVVISMLASTSGSTDDYHTVYDNVSGLKFGSIVFYEGYQVGQVDSIEPIQRNGQTAFRVNLSVSEGWQIPVDSVASATVSGLLSAMTIDIRGGESTTLLKPGAEISGIPPTNFFAALSDIGAEFGDLSVTSIRPLLENLNKYVQEMGDATMDHLPGILQNTETLSAALSQDIPAITASLRRVSELLETDLLRPENRENVAAALANLEVVTHNLNNTLHQVDQLVGDNAGNVDESLRNLRYTLDTVSRYIDDITHNADSTLRNLAEFSRAIRENPSLFITGSAPEDRSQGAGK
jgi:phospholipid/cholesterol/gamma-HCH transport system substrate-binding protein